MIVAGFPSTSGGSGGGGGGGGGLIASASPTRLNKLGTGATLTTANTTVTASGGTGPYSYNWVAAGVTINSPTSATSSFTYGPLGNGQSYSVTAVCTVTDSASATADASCDLYFERIS